MYPAVVIVFLLVTFKLFEGGGLPAGECSGYGSFSLGQGFINLAHLHLNRGCVVSCCLPESVVCVCVLNE